MRLDNLYPKFVTVALIFLLVVTIAPMYASDSSSPGGILGSVSVVGQVNLRGVKMAGESTLFPGDQLVVADNGYAKLVMANGQKLELGPHADATFGHDQDAAIHVRSGNVSFSSATSAPLNIVFGAYEIANNLAAFGSLAFVGDDFVQIRVLTGSVLVRNLTTKESELVSSGSSRLLSLRPASPKAPLGQLASTLPPVLPPIASGSSSDGGLSSRGWFKTLLIFAGLSTTATVAAITPGVQRSAAASNLMRTVQTAVTVGQQAQTAAAQVAQIASQTNVAIANDAYDLRLAAQTSMSLQAQDIHVRALASQERIGALLSQLQQLRVQLQSASTADNSIQGQSNALIQQLNSEFSNLNGLIGKLGSLLAQAVNNGVPNVPNVNIQAIPPIAVASGSTP